MNKEIRILKKFETHAAYCFVQRYGFIALYILWFMMEILINCSTAGQAVPHGVFIKIQSLLKYALIFYILFFQNYTLKEILIIIPVSVLLYYSARLSHFHELFYTWLLIVGRKNTGFKKIAISSFCMLGIAIPLFALFCKLGVFPDAGIFRGEQYRTALGFIHPNSFGVRIFIFSACWYYCRREKLCLYDYFINIAIAVFVWLVPNSRTSSICIILMTLLLALYSNPRFFQSVLRTGLNYVLICCAVTINIGTVLLSLFYSGSNDFMRFCDKVLSGRLSIASQLYKEFGVTILGQQIYVNKSERIYAGLGTEAINFDNSYMRILLHWGIIIYIIVSVFIIWGLIYEKRRKNPALFLLLFMVLIYSFSEKILYQGTYNVFILALADLLFGKVSPDPTFQDVQVPESL